MTTNERLLEKLKKIAEPKAVYNKDMETYLDRIVKVCIDLAKECIEIIEEEGGEAPFEEGQEVIITKNFYAHEFEIGATVTLLGRTEDGWTAGDGEDWWYIGEDEIKHK